MSLSINDTRHNAMPCAECRYAECLVLFAIMLCVVMLNVVMLSVMAPNLGESNVYKVDLYHSGYNITLHHAHHWHHSIYSCAYKISFSVRFQVGRHFAWGTLMAIL